MPWNIHGMSEEMGLVRFEVVRVEGKPLALNIDYVLNIEGKHQGVNQTIELQPTRLCSGGLRWWFICPGMIDGKRCGRRVRKLYLPPGRLYFGCRHCYDLAYMSSQNPETRVEMPEEIRGYLSLLWIGNPVY
jgi:hypothetical protein